MDAPMREAARRSSGVYDHDAPVDAMGSQTAIAGEGAPPAGFVGYDVGDVGAVPPTQPPPPKIPFWKTRKFIIIATINAILAIVILFVVLFPVVRAIAQLVVNRSVLNIDTAAITKPQNNSRGVVTHTGIFNAKIAFEEPVTVDWLVNGPKDTQNKTTLGTMQLQVLNAKSKRATIDQNVTFHISDEQAFGAFTGAMITQPNFTWLLTSNNLRVNALKFPVSKGIHFSKILTLNGINNFDGHVKLVDFQLPRDDPQGGITFKAVTGLNNSSPFLVDLGTTVFNLTYQGVFLGQGTGTKTIVAPGENNITLNGRLVPHNGSESELAVLGQLFSKYLNSDPATTVMARGVSTLQSDGIAISWLSKGLSSLALNVPFVPATPINAISAIDIESLDLTFAPKNPWSPAASSNTVHATLKLPFGFDLSIGEIANSFAIMQNNSIVANISTPIGASNSSVKVLSPTDTEGSINITLSESPLNVPNDAHQTFATFNQELTDSNSTTFQLVGFSSAVSNLSIGQITLSPINFNVTSTLNGLEGLKGSTVIDSVDVMGGTSEHINLNINVSIFNPSSLNLKTGDLILQLTRGGAVVGTTLLPNLSLAQGNNTLAATSDFTPNHSPQGIQTLNEFVSGTDVLLGISGYSGSTNVSSLLQAFESVNISATLPGLKTSLLNSASLTILDTTGKQNNISHVTVDLNNPFTSGLMITNINSTVTSHGLTLGTILTATNFPAGGHSTTTSPSLELNMNLDPPTIFTLLRRLAVQAGEGTDQLDGIVSIGGIKYAASTDQDGAKISERRRLSTRGNLFTGFNLPQFVDTAFKQLQSDIVLTSDVSIGDYPTTLSFTQTAVAVKTDQSLNLLLPILAQPIVQKIITGSVLAIDTVLITNPQENSFETFLTGSITNAGPFDALIDFGEGLTISFSGQSLGTIAMPKVQVTGDVGAQLNVSAVFKVADVGRLTDFTKVLLTEENFVWDIAGENLTVSALGIDVPGVALTTKSVTLKGMNGLQGGVVIDSFDLPSNDPAGGIHLTLQTTVTNPSQVGVALSQIGFNNFVGQTFLGPAASSGAFTLAPQSSFKLPLVGRLVPQNSDSGLATVSQVFTDFIHGKASNVTVMGNSAGPSDVTWLNDAIKSLQISTVLPSQGPLQVIKSITLEQLELDFTPQTAFNPATSSGATTAAFTLPFAFPIDIVALQQTITASIQGQSFAQLAVPKGPSTTDVNARIIHLTFSNVPFAVFDDKHPVFQQFLAQTTTAKSETFGLSGAADTDAQTAVGLLSLTGINFDVQTTIAGLQGLNAKPAVVSNLDVNHGFPDFLLIKVTTTLNNPSNLTIAIGDVAFNLLFENQNIGQADISGLKVIPGDANYSTDVHFQPQGGAEAAGRTLLENFLQGVTSQTVIVGSSDTTNVESLVPALEQITLNADIPALHQNLITATNIVFPPDIVKTGIASATVALSNPFTASINLLVVSANAVFQNLTLGKVDHVDLSSNPIHADGHTNITSPALPLKFNLDPATIIQLLLIRSQQKGVDLGPLTGLFQLVVENPDFHPPIVATIDPNPPTCVSGKQFDVNDAILNALAGLEVTLEVDSLVKLDDFETELTFNQANVPAVTDKTALFLIGAVSPPVVQTLVNQAALTFNSANITNISDEGFDVSLQGSLTGTGPLDAEITFVEPVTVNFQGRDIATIALPPVCAAANVGVPDYRTQGRLTITDLGAFTDFATFLLHNPSFEWIISTNKLRLTALGTIFDDVVLTKNVTFKAFNGLPGVTISNFQLPADDPAGGITISTDSLIPSVAQLGIQLGTVSFNSLFNGVLVGPLTGTNLFLAPEAVTKEHLGGRIVPQTGNDLDVIGVLFSNFLAGKNQTLQVQGNSVDPNGNGQTVSWLSTAFKTLTLNVTLPGQIFQIIDSITIEDLELVLDQPSEDFKPLTSSKTTAATFKNPFGFSLQVIRSAQDITIGFDGADAAELKIPSSPTISGVSTGNVASLTLSFENQTLNALNNNVFGSFFAQVTDKQSAAITLKGSTDIVAHTTIGDVPISGIPFNVSSSIAGINSFGGTAALSNVTITGSGGNGGDQFIVSPLLTTLQNPSNISLVTTGISLPVLFKGVELGRAAINNFDLVPGQNVQPSEFHYMPANPNDTIAQSFLSAFLTTPNSLPLTIKGDSASSPFASLQPALSGVSLDTSLTGQNQKLLSHINVFITLNSLVTNLVTIDFDVVNPTDADLVIKFVQADAMVNGEVFAHFDQAFDNFVVPAHGTANSGSVPNVILTQGAVNSLGIIPLGMLDIGAAQTVLIGQGGYEIPWLVILQPGVPTTYHLDLLNLLDLPLPALKQAVSSMVSAASSESAKGSTSTVPGATVTDGKSVSTPATPASVETSSKASSLAPPANTISAPTPTATPPASEVKGSAADPSNTASLSS
ncbi:hypothetical protein BU17DRAFT_84312 [Hysterangium stoloniferum]|nr:hypothetical protein BU17DRAFT_84312 [Hysterangium stoloniferum]